MRIYFKNKHTIVLIFLCCSIAFGQSNKSLTYEKLKTGIANYLVEIDYFKSIEEYYADTDKFHLKGFFNEIIDKSSISDGIYQFSSGSSHEIPWLILVDNGNYKILNLSSKNELYTTLIEILNFSGNKSYCKEIVLEYVERLFNWHFLMQQYKRQSNCYFPENNNSALSEQTIGELKTKLIGSLKDKSIIKDGNFYILLLEKIDEFNLTVFMHSSNENYISTILHKGYYHFTVTDNLEYGVNFYLLLNDIDYELVTIQGGESMEQELFSLLSFGIKQEFCMEKVKYILLRYLEEALSLDSCLSDIKKKLP